VFEKEHRVVVADGGLDQSLSVIGGGRTDDFQPRCVSEVGFGILGVKWSAVDAAS
jgi:hypothetical protein